MQEARAGELRRSRMRRGRLSTILAGGLGGESGFAGAPLATTLGGDRR